MKLLGRQKGAFYLNADNSIISSNLQAIAGPDKVLILGSDNSVLDTNGLDFRNKVSTNKFNKEIDFLKELSYFSSGEKKKFVSSLTNGSELISVKTNHSFVKNQQYYLFNYVGHDASYPNAWGTASFITEVVDSISNTSLAGVSLSGGNIENIELYIINNRVSNKNTFRTDNDSDLLINSSNSVNVSNVSKIAIDGLDFGGLGFEKISSTLGGNIFPSYLGYHSSELIKDYIYLLGGYTSLQEVKKFITTTDTLATTYLSSVLLTNRYASASIKKGNLIYLIGSSLGTQNNIETFSAVTDSSAGAFSSFDTTKSRSTSELVSNYIYAMGGDSPSLQKVEKFDINSSTFLGETGTNVLTFNTSRHASVLYKNFIYLIAGINTLQKLRKFNVSNDTDSSEIGTDILNVNRYDLSATLVGDSVYIMAGFYSSTIEKLNVNTDTVSNISSASTSRYGHTANLVGNMIYLMGGKYSQTGQKFNASRTSTLSNIISLRFNQ